jgi:hypothetical protein
MKLLQICFKLRIPVFIFTGLISSNGLHADSPCESFVAKVVYITGTDRHDSGYVYLQRYRDGALLFNFIDENFTIHNRISFSQIDFSKINGIDTASYHRILAVNRSVLKDTSVSKDDNGYLILKKLPIARCFHDFRYTDTVNYTLYSINADNEAGYSLDSTVDYQSQVIHYGQAEYLNTDTIKLILLDTIMWCGDSDQLQFLDREQVKQIKYSKACSFFRLADSNSQQWWIDFFCYDPGWNKNRILSSLDLKRIDENFLNYGGENIFNDFPRELQKAIKSHKILYLLRWCP